MRESIELRPAWLKLSRVAKDMDCSVATVKQWIADGKIVAVQPRPNGQWRVNRDSLDAWLDSLRSRCFTSDDDAAAGS